jgi:spectinomycin phosphotransferase
MIPDVVASMDRLAAELRERRIPQVICHADLHPSNVLRAAAGGVSVIDWDDVMIAPKERDFIFTGDPPDGARAGSPFFRGYGACKADWTALAYFRYERVVQDLIAYAEEALVREDLSEETKRLAAKSFAANLDGPMLAAAQETLRRSLS